MASTALTTTTTTPAPPAVVLPDGTIDQTPFSSQYKSIFTLQEPMKPLLPTLKHVNCNYLSTPGVAPTLLELKQHAQSLVILIKYLTVNTMPGLINGAEVSIDGAPTFSDGETYDFLTDLGEAYEGPKNKNVMIRHHKMPLTALLNVLQETAIPAHHRDHDHDMDNDPDYDNPDDVAFISTDMCPLHSVRPRTENESSMPYATHQALISHANEVLELLDHEYSAKGGLLSILPPPEQTEDRAKAETTLLGQLIIYMQKLVGRVHELERSYANAMDALAGEAIVPSQTLSKLGPDGRAPREMVYPQDRFVLVNAGEDVWGFLHKEFEKKEVVDEYVAEENLKSGVSGPTAWVKTETGQTMSRGLTAIDITTRYYRLRKDPLKTIFVIPAHSEHPGTKATIKIESEPTVVNVVKPCWPERASMWEMKNREDLAKYKQLQQDHQIAQQTLQVKTTAESLLLADNKVKDATITAFREEMKKVRSYLDLPENERLATLVTNATQTHAANIQNQQYAANYNAHQAAHIKAEADLQAQKAAFATRVRGELDFIQAASNKAQADYLNRKAELDAQDLANGQTAAAVVKKLETAWRIKMNNVEQMVAYLRAKGVLNTTDPVSQDIIRDSRVESDRLIAAAWAQPSNAPPTPPNSVSP